MLVLCRYVAFDKYGEVDRCAMIRVSHIDEVPVRFAEHMASLVRNWNEFNMGPMIYRWRLISWLPERHLKLVWSAKKAQ